jgi:Protein of unknown function (DUF1822)
VLIPLNAASTLVDLAPDRVKFAIALSQAIQNPLTRWQSYLALLALEGFVQWISDRSTPICLDRTQARLLEPPEFGVPAAINGVYANQFQIGLLVVEDDVEDEIEFPTSLMRNPAHFYVAACVHEETHQVSFHSFLRGDRLNPSSATEATCTIPISLFETNLERLLWYLASLELSAIPLPNMSPAISSQWLIQPLVNAAQWLQTQIDELAWTRFTPELAPAVGMRSRVHAFSADLSSFYGTIWLPIDHPQPSHFSTLFNDLGSRSNPRARMVFTCHLRISSNPNLTHRHATNHSSR